MADVQRYVNAASSAGGDGTTNATAGANRAFESMNAAINAATYGAAAAKSTSDRWLINCEGTTVDSTQFSVSGAANSTSANPIVFRAVGGNRHSGTWSTSCFRHALSVGTYGWGTIRVTAGSPFIHFEGIQFEQSRTKGDEVQIFDLTLGTGRVVVDGCLLRYTGGGTATDQTAMFHTHGATAYTLKVVNCIGYDGGSIFASDYNGSAQAIQFGNCTFYGFTHNNAALPLLVLSNIDGGTIYLKNLVLHGTTRSAYAAPSSGTLTQSRVLTYDATSPSGAGYQNKTPTFVNAAGKDFHLDSGDTNAKDQGVDNSADTEVSGTSVASSLDVDGASRSGTWDIGADEITSVVIVVSEEDPLFIQPQWGRTRVVDIW